MARNRQEIPREERSAEIVAAAAELFLKQGYASTTMADIGRRVGATPANVYWYFPSKDDLFAAVMDRMLDRQMLVVEHEMARLEPLSKLTRSMSDMRAYAGLHHEMHQRMDDSPTVLAAHKRFLGWIRTMVVDIITGHEVRDPDVLVDAIICVFEGAHRLDPPRTGTEMIRYLLDSYALPARD